MADQGPAKFGDDPRVDRYPTGVIQPVAMQDDRLAHRRLYGLESRAEFPLPMLDPLALERVQADVPIGDQFGRAKRRLGRAGNDCLDRSDVRLPVRRAFDFLALMPVVWPPA